MAPGIFTISYSCALMVPIISGLAWDLSGLPASRIGLHSRCARRGDDDLLGPNARRVPEARSGMTIISAGFATPLGATNDRSRSWST